MNLSQRQIMIIGIVVALGVVGWLLIQAGLRPNLGKTATVTVWGVNDPGELWIQMTKQYSEETGNKVVYVQKSPETYEQDLVNALAAGNGPDVFYFKNTWLVKHFKKLAPAPQSAFTPQSMESTYPQVASRDFVTNGNVYAVPLYIDSLAMFYNPALLDQAAIPFPPKTWQELLAMVPKLKRVDLSGTIQVAGVALGLGSNVQYASDLLSLLMMQSGSQMIDNTNRATFNDQVGRQAMDFTAQFAQLGTDAYTWNQNMEPSLEAFAKGKAAIAFGYASDLAAIRSVAPYLDFKIAPIPQPQGATLRTDYASYWGLAVSRQTPNRDAAWQLISAVTQANPSAAYMNATNLPPAKRVLLQSTQGNPIFDTFNRQAYTARSWPQPDPTIVDKVFRDAIDNVAARRMTTSDALDAMAKQVNKLFEDIL